MSARDEEEALYGLKLHVDRYSEPVTSALKDAGIQVVPSPTCFKVLHTSFRGDIKELLKEVPTLSHYPVKQYKWWHKLSDSIRGD